MDSPTLSHPWARYLRWLAGTLIGLLAAVGGLNLLADPLGVFGTPRIPGFSATKPYIYHHQELARWQAARRLCPTAGIFGNSRAEIGFDPEHPVFAARSLSAFNHAIPGSGGNTAVAQLGWLQAAGCAPKIAILGVEFFEFLGGPAAVPAATQLSPAPRPDSAYFAEAVLSIIGLRDVANTIATQRAHNPPTTTSRGFNPLLQAIGEIEASGHYLAFRQRAQENLRMWRQKAPRLHAADGGITAGQQAVETFLARATASGATVHVLIYPYHAQIRLMQERLGLGGLFTDWKKRIFELAARHPGVRVWDFSGIGPETLEAIPPRGDRTTSMAYYWEAGHFKKALGDKALERLFGRSDGFGIELRPDNIDAWLAEDRRRVQAQLSTPSALRDDVDELFAQARR